MTPLAAETEPAQKRFPSLAKPCSLKASERLIGFVSFAYLTWILCPIRYFAPTRANADNTWFFALNYAATHHLAFGRDVVWTWGPLAYLLVPFDLGSNLARGLAFQTALWTLVAIVLWDLLVSSRLPVRTVALFSLFIAFCSLAYDVYPSNLLLPLALILLVHYQTRGGTSRLVAALFLIGLLPLVQFAAAVVAAGVIAGFVLHRVLRRPAATRREIALALCVPSFVAIFTGFFAFNSFADSAAYLKSSQELAKGYAIAMSFSGPPSQIVLALLALALLLAVFALLAFARNKLVVFYALILAVPALFELRHGLVRQDEAHLTQFVCFIAFALALLTLSVDLQRRTVEIAACFVVFAFFPLWRQATSAGNFPRTASLLIGQTVPQRIWDVLHYKTLRRTLQATALHNANDFGLDASIRQIVANQSVAFLSPQYSNALGENLNLAFLPVLQNYSAYTSYLDEFNARWISSRGPQFLAFDGLAIDNRHAWVEAPATWAAVYRWYDARSLGQRYLLLERRSEARFKDFDVAESRNIKFGEVIPVPQSDQPMFWSLTCSLNSLGRLRAALLRVPEVTATIFFPAGRARVFRVIPPVLLAPSPANDLPFTLAEYAQVFAPTPAKPDASPQALMFSGSGTHSYNPGCQLQFLHMRP